MYFRQEVGKWGENLACHYLQENNYKIIERNFFCRQGEIDIVAKDLTNGELVFFEVKTRSNFNYGNPADAVNKQKQRHMVQAIKYYLYKNDIRHMPIRVDVLEVFILQNYEINHIRQIL